MMLALIWICVIFITLCFWVKHKYSYFVLRGARQIPLKLLFGEIFKVLAQRQHLFELSTNIYNHYPNDRFVGVYEITAPAVLIRDPELIKDITIRNFDHFVNRRRFIATHDLIIGKTLAALPGEQWKRMRSMLTPFFSTSKLKFLIKLVKACSKVVFEDLEEKISNTPDKYLDVDTRDLLTRYSSDVMATCAFGIEVNSIKERDHSFYLMGKKMNKFSLPETLKVILILVMPIIYKVFNMQLLNDNASKFMRNTLFSVIKDREERNNYRPDMIQILVEIKKVFHDDYVLAQAVLFYLASHELVSTSMVFTLYELAVNNDIQEKLHQEIDEHLTKYEGQLEYENIDNLKYLQMVVSEALRKWPLFVMTDRECTKPYNIGKSNASFDKDFIVEKGIAMTIPIFAIHHDPKYYENPETFDPERFSEENINKINPFTYLPFGLGPRKCIATRFSMLQMKVLIASIIYRFKITPAPSTLIPPRLDTTELNLRLVGGHFLRFQSRT